MNAELRFPAGTRVALTGASGFVGRQLTELLTATGADVLALVRSTSKTADLEKLGVRCLPVDLDDPATIAAALPGCDYLFHVAGAVDFKDDWDHLRRVNVQGSLNALEAARRAGVRRFVQTSSIVAIGATRTREVLSETATWNLGPLAVGYATTKREAEDAVLAARPAGVDVVVVNPACVIGPGDGGTSEFGALCKRFWKGRIPFYFAGGNNFVDVRDVAEGHVRAALFGKAGERYLLGGQNLDYRHFFDILAEIRKKRTFRVRLPVAFAPVMAWMEARLTKPNKRLYLPRGQARLMGYYFFGSSAKAEAELGYRPRPVEHSLREAYRSYFGAPA